LIIEADYLDPGDHADETAATLKSASTESWQPPLRLRQPPHKLFPEHDRMHAPVPARFLAVTGAHSKRGDALFGALPLTLFATTNSFRVLVTSL
jgi:hypothetical protein